MCFSRIQKKLRAILSPLNSVKFVVVFLVGLLSIWAIFQVVTLPYLNAKEKMMSTDTHSSAKTVKKLTRGENSLHRRIEVEASKIMKKDGLSVGIWINHGNLQDDDPLLVEYVREVHLIPPNVNTPYQLRTTNISYGLAQHVMEFFEDVRDGFFVECGANDGEFLSNTLKLEWDLHWTGLLIEADTNTFPMLRSTNRKAWLSDVCLSNETRPKTTSFFRSAILGDSGLGGLRKRAEAGVLEEIKVKCFPFYTMLLALNRTVVDFLSLDIEGVELEVLKTIPFDKVLFKTMAIEHWTIPEGAAGLKAFMDSKGYKFIMKTTGYDSIFVHGSIYCNKYQC